ncbi:hypothetical protein Tco_0838337 [Tanacetum coccineum]|uniref:Uncharacterized protein n=1 Tax=Tanacetum coccineum TaxID=301880 RepID=A0ABQ5AMI3_9ASTR
MNNHPLTGRTSEGLFIQKKKLLFLVNIKDPAISISDQLLSTQTHPFELPSTGDTVLDFVNELGYPEPIEFVSSIRTNYVYQPWRAILSLLNQCRTGKTSGSDKPRHPVLQMLWGIVTQTNIDPCRAHNLWKSETVEVLEWQSPDPLITEANQQSPYFQPSENGCCEYHENSSRRCKVQPATSVATPKKTDNTTQSNNQAAPHRQRLPSGQASTEIWKTPQENGRRPEKGDDAVLERAFKLSLDQPSATWCWRTSRGNDHGNRFRSKLPKYCKNGRRERPFCQSDDQSSSDFDNGPRAQPDDVNFLRNHTDSDATHPWIAPFRQIQFQNISAVTLHQSNTEATTITTSLLKSLHSHRPSAMNQNEQDEETDSTYSIRQTDKVDLEEFDLKSALFSHMNKKKSANKNTTNYRLYHALMEALIADEEAMDKKLRPSPSAGSNQGRESDASASKQHPSFTSTGWQITDTRDTGADSSMHRSDPESEHSEQSSDDISKQDERNDSDMEDTGKMLTSKVSTTTCLSHFQIVRDLLRLNHSRRKTYDIGVLSNGSVKRTERKKLCKADLEVLSMASLTGGVGGREFYIQQHSESSDREAVR